MRVGRGIAQGLLLVPISGVVTLASLAVWRFGPDYVSYCGNERTPSGSIVACEAPVLNAGWPAPFLFDFPLMSFQNALGIEDRFYWTPFLANWLFYGALLSIALKLMASLRARGSGSSGASLPRMIACMGMGLTVLAFAGAVLAVSTITVVQRGPYDVLRCRLGVMDGVQVNCPEPTLAGGWPVPFLYDRAGVSVEGRLGPEDDLRLGPFLATAVFYAVLAWLAWMGMRAIRQQVARPTTYPTDEGKGR